MNTTQEQFERIDLISKKLGELRILVSEIDILFNLRGLDGCNDNLRELEREVYRTILNNMGHEIGLLKSALLTMYYEIKDNE